MTTRISAIIQLRKLLSEMEHSCGLSGHGSGAKDVLYAAIDAADGEGLVSTSQIQTHPLTKGMPRATFFRALVSLEQSGSLRRPEGASRGWFRVDAN